MHLFDLVRTDCSDCHGQKVEEVKAPKIIFLYSFSGTTVRIKAEQVNENDISGKLRVESRTSMFLQDRMTRNKISFLLNV